MWRVDFGGVRYYFYKLCMLRGHTCYRYMDIHCTIVLARLVIFSDSYCLHYRSKHHIFQPPTTSASYKNHSDHTTHTPQSSS